MMLLPGVILCLVCAHGASFFSAPSYPAWSRVSYDPYLNTPGPFSSKGRALVFGATANDDRREDMGNEDEDEDEDEEPGKMRVSELKAELDLRGVDYSGCFDKESLAAKLLQARATGKANPDIIDDFNKMRVRSCLERGWNLTLTFSFWLRIGFLHHSYLKVCFPFGLM